MEKKPVSPIMYEPAPAPAPPPAPAPVQLAPIEQPISPQIMPIQQFEPECPIYPIMPVCCPPVFKPCCRPFLKSCFCSRPFHHRPFFFPRPLYTPYQGQNPWGY